MSDHSPPDRPAPYYDIDVKLEYNVTITVKGDWNRVSIGDVRDKAKDNLQENLNGNWSGNVSLINDLRILDARLHEE